MGSFLYFIILIFLLTYSPMSFFHLNSQYIHFFFALDIYTLFFGEHQMKFTRKLFSLEFAIFHYSRKFFRFFHLLIIVFLPGNLFFDKFSLRFPFFTSNINVFLFAQKEIARNFFFHFFLKKITRIK